MAGMRLAVLGCGAQGASVAADLTRAGLDVTLIEQWPAHVEAMRAGGITVNFPDRAEVTPVRVLHLCQIAELRQSFDAVFVLVKAYDTRWTCEMIRPVLAEDGLVVGVQNGMTHRVIADVLGPQRTVGAVFDMASNMFTPGTVTRQNDRDTSWFALGALDPGVQSRVGALAQVLRHAGRVEVSDDIHSAKWMKLVVNAAQLVPSAVLDLPFAAAMALPGIERVMRAAGYEAMRAALADGARMVPILGLTLPQTNDPETVVDAIFDEVARSFMRPDTLTTVLQDWRKGRHSEVEELNGHVAATLEANGQAAPVNRAVIRLALEIERGTRQAGPDLAADLLAAV